MKKLILALLVIVLVSCSKEENKPASAKELITGKTWTHQGFINDLNMNQLPDDTLTGRLNLSLKFGTDNHLMYTLNGESQDVTWAFILNETAIEITGLQFDSTIVHGQPVSDLMIKTLNQDSLVFYGTTEQYPEMITFNVFK
ncbi:MAG TPA: hypothetical protein VK172_08150 [Lentimicrobium sp.]|nr:hypothetical protein [Bacteroidales bacterium]HLO91120.1 hypothetical protein [Lentimicrobium sp.]